MFHWQRISIAQIQQRLIIKRAIYEDATNLFDRHLVQPCCATNNRQDVVEQKSKVFFISNLRRKREKKTPITLLPNNQNQKSAHQFDDHSIERWVQCRPSSIWRLICVLLYEMPRPTPVNLATQRNMSCSHG